jgi:hypothetical protein
LNHIVDSGGRLSLVPDADSDSTLLSHVEDSVLGSSGLLPPFYALIANGHSTEIHKTDSPSSQRDTPSGETPDRTECTAPSHDVLGSDDSGSHGSSQTLDHTSRSDTCSCSYYDNITESISHFATFPTEIPRRCIKAGTSEKGACSVCRAPWVRVVERIPTGQKQKTGSNWDTGPGAHGAFHRNGRETQPADQDVMQTVTTGWQPGCTCDAEVIPCTVLDVFAGAGTTGLVADELGRDCILVELNATYAEMARKRIYGAAPLFASVEVA